jgi:hypothetical protein
MEAMDILAGLAPIVKAPGFLFAGLGVLIWGSKTNKD